MEGDSRTAACAALAGGEAVVVANPAPMAYGLVATTARAVNAAKGRQLDQNVAVSLHDPSLWRELTPALDLPHAVLGPVVALLRRRLTLLLPMGGAVPAPAWSAPAVRDGSLAVFNGYWAASGWLWQRFPRLYGSSANLTGVPPVSTARDAIAMFGAQRVVVDAGEIAEPTPRWSSTMVRLDSAGRIQLHRSGAQDQVSGLPPKDFIRELARSVDLRPASRATR